MITKQEIEKFIDKTGKLNANYYKEYEFPTDNIGKYLYNIYNDVKEAPLCPICEKELQFISFANGYKEFCSKKCEYKKYPERKKKYKKKEYKYQFTIDEKSIEYFRKNKNIHHLIVPEEYKDITPTEYLYLSTIDFKIPVCENFTCNNKPPFLSFEKGYQKTCCSKCAGSLTSTLEKRKKTVKKKYGVEFVSQLEESTKKVKVTKLEHYGDENYNNYKQYKNTCLKRYGVDNIFKDLEFRKTYEQKRVDSIRENSTLDNNWVCRGDFDPNIEKRKQTCLERYGVEHYVQSEKFQEKVPEISKKIWKTKKKNGTTNTSKEEDEIYDLLTSEFVNVKREYKSEKYPNSCDFYISDLDLYIEYQGFFTHGNKAFFNTEEDKILLEKIELKSEESTFYKNSLKIWTELDVKKRETAYKNNLNYLEIFDKENILTQIRRVIEGLSTKKNDKELFREYELIKRKEGRLSTSPTDNKIVTHFQDHFFKRENDIYKNNPIIRRKLIQNRMKYLNKKEHELTDRELLSGFKISGILRSYSYFSPTWFKYFIEKYNVKNIYDPFGGWGHRLLGSHILDKYIYNDIDNRTCKGINEIIAFLGIKNTIVYNEDANDFKPKEKYEAIFMCPPYDNIEIYQNPIDDFKLLIQHVLVKNYIQNNNVKICGIIIKETFEYLLVDILGEYKEKEIVNRKKDHFTKNKINEFLYTWRK